MKASNQSQIWRWQLMKVKRNKNVTRDETE